MNFDSEVIEFPCPKCGKKLEETVGRLKNNQNLTCFHCAVTFGVNAEKLRSGLQSAQKSIDNFMAELRNIGK